MPHSFTPGPWLLRTTPTSAGLCHIVSAADWRGAFIYGDGIRKGVDDALPKAQELAANARLIAAANPAVISELLDRLEAAEADALEQSRLNGMGSEREAALIDRLEAAERERNVLKAKVEQMDAAFESLLIRCDDSDSEMYGTLSTSFVRDIARIARGT